MVERVKAVIKHYGMTDRAFALTCGLKQNTFCNQLNGKRDISLTTIESILNSFSEISAEWLMRGKGSMFIPSNNHEPENLSSLVDTIATLTSVVKSKDARIKELEEEIAYLKKK